MARRCGGGFIGKTIVDESRMMRTSIELARLRLDLAVTMSKYSPLGTRRAATGLLLSGPRSDIKCTRRRRSSISDAVVGEIQSVPLRSDSHGE